MFRVVMHALWTRDYVATLTRLLQDTMAISEAEAKEVFEELSKGKRKEILCATPGIAYDLSCDLIQMGVYTDAEQAGPITPEIIAHDMGILMHEDLSMFWVHRDANVEDSDHGGKVIRLVQKNTLGFVIFEDAATAQLVGDLVEERGGERIGNERMDEILRETEMLRDARVKYAKMMTMRYGRDWKRIPWAMRAGQEPQGNLSGQEEE